MLKLACPYCGHPENNDRWIHRCVFPGRKSGWFVEIGAADGIAGSSCNFLERIGWRGICVEPSLSFFSRLCRNRPKAICENACISDRTGHVPFQENSYLSRVVYRAQHEFDRRRRRMVALTLLDLLEKHKAPKIIDYVAMDCEGSERRILRVFPFNEYRILAISTEGDRANDILLHNKFVNVSNPFNTACPWERYYVHESVICPSACLARNLNRP